ncbi:MAG: heavy-metal-associated domain-containing protein [Rikenellaceae bacterium]|nr:heavy-metal-associated domain-containing protein [Rikenellaceae bacterium]
MKKLIIMCLMAFIGFGVAEASAQKKNDAAIKTTVFVTDIDCEHCAKKITNTIPYEKGVKDVKVDVPTKLVTVTYDATKNSDANLLKSFAKIKVKAEVQKAEEKQ